MKKLNALVALLLLVIVTGCSQVNAISTIRRAYPPPARIQQIPGSDWEWLVQESNQVYWIESQGAVFVSPEATPDELQKHLEPILIFDNQQGF